MYEKFPAGCGVSTVMPDMDFETYSDAGYVWNEGKQKWDSAGVGVDRGLQLVGSVAYSEHPSTDVLRLAYDLKDGIGPRLWIPSMAPPQELFDHIARGGLIEAWNCSFEFYIWKNVCHARMGWPELPYYQLRDAMAKAQAHSLPAKLSNCAKALGTLEKMEEGKRLINKFSKPRKPTKKDPRKRILPDDDTADAELLGQYCIGDIASESEISKTLPDLDTDELELWLLDQKINTTGCYIDAAALKACTEIVNATIAKHTRELNTITNGVIETVNQSKEIVGWLGAHGIITKSIDKEHVELLLAREDVQGVPRRVLEIRKLIGSSAVKKLFSINHRISKDGRLRGLFAFCGADRTGRFAGRGPQPQNLPNSGPKVGLCEKCGHVHGLKCQSCPKCGEDAFRKTIDWGIQGVDSALELAISGGLEALENEYDDIIECVSGCLRGLFVAPPENDFISSDYSAIEAVVLAMLSGEQWRIDVFRDHGKIYEMSASKITGISFDEMMRYKKETGEHHPSRKKIGKVSELASGYQGGIGAWKNFGADKFMTDPEIKDAIKLWRKESPMIVKFWEGVQDAAINAVKHPGSCFAYRGVTYGVKGDVLYCQLPSGRKLSYHAPQLHRELTPWHKEVDKLTYMGNHSVYGWQRLDTYGGKLTENIVQAVARDILTHAMVKLDKAGYNLTLHIHDEVVAEVPKGWGSVEELERIMAQMPPWASDWPISAAGGWRGKRYRKG